MDEIQAQSVLDEIKKIRNCVSNIYNSSNKSSLESGKLFNISCAAHTLYTIALSEKNESIYGNLLKYRDKALAELETAGRLTHH